MWKYNLNIKWNYSTHNIIMNLVWKNNVVLDVWCNKWYIWQNSDNSNIFYWLEYDYEAIIEAKIIYKDAIEYDLNNLNDLPWGIKFDIIVFADVLEHVLYPDEVLSFLKKYLKNDWNVIVSLPNVANWQVRLNLLFWNFNYTETGIMDKTHLHFYTFKTAKNLLLKEWFSINWEYAWASFFWKIIKFLPFLKTLLSTNIIFHAKK